MIDAAEIEENSENGQEAEISNLHMGTGEGWKSFVLSVS